MSWISRLRYLITSGCLYLDNSPTTMRSLTDWFSEYSDSHQNQLNKRIHFICVPLIFFAVCGLIMSIPFHVASWYHPSEHPLVLNWSFHVLIFVVLFYLRLSWKMGLKMLVFSALCLIGNYWLSQVTTLWLVSLILFTAGWIGQFYGHHVEGKKPSFVKDLQFLLIGPAWVMEELFG